MPIALTILLAGSALLLGACARSLPEAPSIHSAASLDAQEAPAADVGLALRSDPPLPGEPLAGWEALEAQPTPPGAGAVHAH